MTLACWVWRSEADAGALVRRGAARPEHHETHKYRREKGIKHSGDDFAQVLGDGRGGPVAVRVAVPWPCPPCCCGWCGSDEGHRPIIARTEGAPLFSAPVMTLAW